MDKHKTIITKSPQETQKVGEELAHDRPKIICLYGELGSGKTTFVQGFARGLGLTTRLLSPTFIIVRRYELPKENFFYHIDLYRMSSMEDLEQLGLSEIFSDPHARVVVEWAERLGKLLPKDRMDIHFTSLSNERHKIVIT